MVMAAWFHVYSNIGDAMAHPTTYNSTQEGTRTYVHTCMCVCHTVHMYIKCSFFAITALGAFKAREFLVHIIICSLEGHTRHNVLSTGPYYNKFCCHGNDIAPYLLVFHARCSLSHAQPNFLKLLLQGLRKN